VVKTLVSQTYTEAVVVFVVVVNCKSEMVVRGLWQPVLLIKDVEYPESLALDEIYVREYTRTQHNIT
jgi:hypothetical protein